MNQSVADRSLTWRSSSFAVRSNTDAFLFAVACHFKGIDLCVGLWRCCEIDQSPDYRAGHDASQSIHFGTACYRQYDASIRTGRYPEWTGFGRIQEAQGQLWKVSRHFFPYESHSTLRRSGSRILLVGVFCLEIFIVCNNCRRGLVKRCLIV